MPAIALSFITPAFDSQLYRPLLAFRVAAGFPSPAGDYVEGRIDLNEHLIRHAKTECHPPQASA